MRRFFVYIFFSGVTTGSIIFNSFSREKCFFIILLLSFFIIVLFFLSLILQKEFVVKNCAFNKKLLTKNRAENQALARKFPTEIVLRAIMIAIFFATATIWYGNHVFDESKIQKFIGEKISISGEIVEEPDRRDFNTRLIIKVGVIENEREKIYANEKVLISVPNYPEYFTGENVKITGKVQIPENFTNESGIEFNYKKFLAKNQIYSLMYSPKIERADVTSEHNAFDKSDSGEEDEIKKFNFWRTIFKIKQTFLERLTRVFPSPEAELLGGILLGVKRSLGTELENNFRKVGLVHIIVLSGYNVTIIAEAIFKFFGFLPKIFAATLGGISVLIFCLMVGSGATVVRSTIMTLLALVARISGRTYSVNRALIFAGGVMIFLNPMILFYDPSFQLSFLATLGLINLSDFVKRFLKFVPEKFNFREITTATFATQITVLPLLMKMTGQLSVIAPIVNIITLQFIPITMLLGFLAGIAGFINQNFGIFVGFVPFLLLKYILSIVNFFAELNFAAISI